MGAEALRSRSSGNPSSSYKEGMFNERVSSVDVEVVVIELRTDLASLAPKVDWSHSWLQGNVLRRKSVPSRPERG
jgi:hypothetical protein